MIRALLDSVNQFFTNDSSLWILAVGGIPLVPLLLVLFFYPFTVLLR